MQAPDLATLLNPAPLVEAALKSRFTADATLAPAFIPRSNGDLPGTRIDITFMMGQWSGRYGVRRNGKIAENTWHYTLNFATYTMRPALGQPDVHAGYVTKLRGIVTAAVVDPTLLDYHTLASLHLQAGTESVRTDEDLDCSATIYNGLITIRSDAWPLEIPPNAVLDEDGNPILNEDGSYVLNES